MDQTLYNQLRDIVASYNYDNGNFYKLFKHAKTSGLRGLSFKQFTAHAKNLGVSSKVSRVDGQLMRALSYDQKADQYIKGLIGLIDTCPNCKGLGVVAIKLPKKKY